MLFKKFIIAFVSIGGFVAALFAAQSPKRPSAPNSSVDFVRDVQPLFAEHCYKCHGAEKQKNGFRLDLKSNLFAGGDSGPAIIPGKSGESRLIQYVSGADPEKIMPPKGEPLSAKQVELLRAWIDQGAAWPENDAKPRSPDHWSFKAPTRPPLPKVKNSKWVRNPIDAFILARLEREKIQPSAEADRFTLIRRLSLDLIGLPPTPDEVKSFVQDRRSDAYERLVTHLLESPHFGEKWARPWLDLARYADSDGYEKDFYRPHAWRWRDWVIHSINNDQPFDQFTRDQIAGDLLPNATLEQQVATGFHRNVLLNREGGVDIEEDRVKGVVDRVNTVSTAWLGLTVGCAECHSHKYDPITQREYYQLYAFFNNTDDRDIRAPLPAEISSVRKKETELDLAKRAYLNDPEADLEAWAEKVAALPDIWTIPKVEDYELPTFGANNGANLYPQEDGSFLATGMVENNTHYIMMLNTSLQNITGIRIEAMTDEMLPKTGPGWAANGNFVLSEVRIEASPLKDVTQLKKFSIEKALADYSQKDFEIEKAVDGNEKTGWAVDMPALAMHGIDRCAVFTTSSNIVHDGGTRMKVSLVQQGGKSHTLGRVRFSMTTANRKEVESQAVPGRIREIARTAPAKRTIEQKVTLKRYYQATFEQDAPALAIYTKALSDAPAIHGSVEGQTIRERLTRRPTNVHIRGEFLNKGPAVETGTLGALHKFKPRQGVPPNRLDLANWLVDPANPLTARVTVNHIWKELFGQGLVPTVSDFGTQGDRPSHPELLDWLATEFVKRKWSRKEMIKLIVSSAAYRQTSEHRLDLQERDPLNKLLARQNRFRLSAELIRDQYLAASGLLDAQIGGTSVDVQSKRRGLYVKFKRAFPEPMLTTFDAPNSTVTCPMRERSNTPLQALTLLNHPLFVECAQGLGRRVVSYPGDFREQLTHGFQLCLARSPSNEDQTDLAALFDQVKADYGSDQGAAKKVAGKLAAATVALPDAAAYTVLARTLLNLDELVTRE